jgi:RNA polymerase sigma factor (sigma-70 family)
VHLPDGQRRKKVTVRDPDWLAERFEENRTQLRAVAYRMLGSVSEADDAVQDAWLRLSRADTSEVQNLSGWLTTVVGRVCLDMLRSRRARREEPLDTPTVEPAASRMGAVVDPEHEALLADSIGLALLVVLDSLTPAERLAFVLHDMFAVPFDEIAPIVGRTTDATKMLASRARRRIGGTAQEGLKAPRDADLVRHREVVGAFLAASRGGNFDALVAVLDPDVVLRADPETVRMGAPKEVAGAAAVADTFAGRARGAKLALIDGAAGAVWSTDGQPRVVFGFTITDGRIVAIEMVSDPVRLAELELEIL